MKQTKIFSFFSGCGLLDLGFERAGYEIAFVNEFRRSFLRAYKHSRSVLKLKPPEFGYSDKSITDYLSYPHLQSELIELVRAARGGRNLVGFIGGPPCPDFSVGGKNRGKSGENGRLSQTYADLVCDSDPDFFLFENVKGLWRTKKHRAFYDSLKAQFIRAGYVLSDRLINSIQYGVPQDRDRIILLGFKSDVFSVNDGVDVPWDQFVAYPQRTAFGFKWPGRSNQAESSLDPPKELTVDFWFRKNDVQKHPNQEHRFQPRAGLARFLEVAEGDDSRKSFKRLHRFRYSPTACYGNNEVHIHPTEPRRISAAEAMAIQSLPKEFELPPDMSLSDMFKTLGNGVPFLAALALANTTRCVVDNKSKNDGEGYNTRNLPPAEATALPLHS
jgi:DNA (cytosine-5)-methyltransferase 1